MRNSSNKEPDLKSIAQSRLQAAAVRAALLKLNSSYTEETLPICIGECGWPTNGDHGADPEATPANAATFLQNCIEKSTYSIFFFEAFDEQLKAQTGANGTSSLKENYFGWLNEAGQKKYNVPALEGTPGPSRHPLPVSWHSGSAVCGWACAVDMDSGSKNGGNARFKRSFGSVSARDNVQCQTAPPIMFVGVC